MQPQFEGLQVHRNEGRLSGSFDLSGADMARVRYGERLVLVCVTDVTDFRVHDDKTSGDTVSTWKFTPADVALVRDDQMVEHLAHALYLQGVDPQLPLSGPPQTPVSTSPASQPTSPQVSGDGVDNQARSSTVPSSRSETGVDPVLASFLSE